MRQSVVDWFAYRLISIAKFIVELALPWTARTAEALWIGRLRWVAFLLLVGFCSSIILMVLTAILKIQTDRIWIMMIILVILIQVLSLMILGIAGSILRFRRRVHWDHSAIQGFSSVAVTRSIRPRRSEPLGVECDFIRSAATLLTRYHPLMSRHHAQTMRADLNRRLDELQDDQSFCDFPSAPDIGEVMSRYRPDHGHFFAYVPERDPGERLPLLLVLHGHGGNALIWPASWKPLADRLGLIVVSPSFGYGQWEHSSAADCLQRTVAAARERFPLSDRLFVAGISQGGCGVTQAAALLRPNGLIYLSPTLNAQLLTAPAIPRTAVLVFQGGRDVNVRPSSVDRAVTALQAADYHVEYHKIEDEDHYLRFRSQKFVDEAIAAWFSKLVAS